jgi:GNAT superfamily N-acetyltransferase
MDERLLIAAKLPDLPRWVEVRADLLWGECEIFGLETGPELSLVVRETDTGTVFVIGRPAHTAVQKALRGEIGEVIVPPEQASRLAVLLPDWSPCRIVLHQLNDRNSLPPVTTDQVGFLDPGRLTQLSLPPELLAELERGAAHSPVAAAFVSGQPVSFCYAGAVTESLWDVSIDTLPEYRRRGYAALSVAYMTDHMQKHGRQPVWAALEENPASWQLARKLGFVPTDELVRFVPDQQLRQ